MFDHFVWSVVAVPVALVVVIALLADRLPPARAARVLAWSAAGTALASVLNVAAFAVVAVAEIPVIAGYFGWSYQTVMADTEQVRWVPWLCVVLLAWAGVAAGRVVRRHRGGRAWAARLAAAESQDGVVRLPAAEAHDGVVMVRSPAVEAFAVPGRPGQVVVTTGMRKILTDRQYEALLAHERAHLAQGHPLLVLLSDLAGALHPALWWVSGRVGYLSERAADEHAAAVVGDRTVVAGAIGTAALAAHGRPPLKDVRFASFARPRRPGAIPRRVAALLGQQNAGGRAWPAVIPAVLAAVPAVLAVSSLIWTGEALYDLVELLVLAHGALH